MRNLIETVNSFEKSGVLSRQSGEDMSILSGFAKKIQQVYLDGRKESLFLDSKSVQEADQERLIQLSWEENQRDIEISLHFVSLSPVYSHNNRISIPTSYQYYYLMNALRFL